KWRSEAEVALAVNRGISARQFLVESLGEKHGRADVHGPAPELREQLALDSNALDPTRVGRHVYFGQHLRERHFDRRARFRIEGDTLYIAHQVAWRRVEVLSLPLV